MVHRVKSLSKPRHLHSIIPSSNPHSFTASNHQIRRLPYKSGQTPYLFCIKRDVLTWYGLTTQTHNKTSGYTSKFIIKVNTKTIKAKATKYSKFARSTVTHEFGHVFWLADNPNTKKSSIMKYDRDRNTMVKPQQFDIDNVNKKYK